MTELLAPAEPTPFTTLTIDQLCVHPLNVRKNEDDANRTMAMEKSIERIGLIFPLVVVPMPEGAEASYGAIAGGRRTRAIRKLIAAGRLPADWPINVTIRELTPAEVVELSFIENFQRVDLRPYENHLAIAQAAELGHSVEEIALNTDQTEKWVRQQLRLGRLHPEIMAAYSAERIGTATAAAFAATEDQALQLAAWQNFRSLPELDQVPAKIRAFYKVGDREEMKLLRFVGEPFYRAEGGGYELDLFEDGPDRGRVMHSTLLRRLAEDKLDQRRASIRLLARRPHLRFAAEVPEYGGTTDFGLEVRADQGHDASGSYIILPEGDVVATLLIDDDGEEELRYWFASRKAKRAAERQAEDAAVSLNSPGAAPNPPADAPMLPTQAGRAIARDQHGLAADGMMAMIAVRLQILRAILVLDASNDGSLARDFLVWEQLWQTFQGPNHRAAGALGLADEPQLAALAGGIHPHLREIGASKVWNATVQQVVEQPFVALADPIEAFVSFVAAAPRIKNLAAAVLAGKAMRRSANIDGCEMPIHDTLVGLAGFSDAMVRRTELWEPTETFLALFQKAQRLAQAEPYLNDAGRMRLAKMTDDQVTRAVGPILQGKDSPDEARAQEARSWLHPVIAFATASAPIAAEIDPVPA